MRFGSRILECMMRALSALPLGFHYAWSGFFAWLMSDVIRYRRGLVMVNLARSFPDKKYKELKQIAKQFYRHFGDIIAEAIWFGGCRNPERLRRKNLVEFVGMKEFVDSYLQSNGAVVLDSHCGNWELLGGFECYDYRMGGVAKIDRKQIVVVYKTLSSKAWDDVMRLNRLAPVLRSGFDGYVSSTEILRFSLKHRNEKRLYIFPTDQCPYRNSTVDETVDFMHQKTKTMLGAASLAHKLGMAVYYMNMVPTSRGHYEWSFKEICMDASQSNPHEIMQTFYNLLQEDIEKTPWNYLWTHNRWKK